MLQTLDLYHNILKNGNPKATPDKSLFFLDSVQFLGQRTQIYHIHPLKSKVDGFLKLQPPKKRKSELCRVSHFFSNYIYNLQVILRPLYLQLRDTTD